MPERPANAKCYVPVDSFITPVDGIDKAFVVGRTPVWEGDPILERIPHMFEELQRIPVDHSGTAA